MWTSLRTALAGPWRLCHKVIDLTPGTNSEFLVVGCVYKDQPLKPSILDEYSGDRFADPPPPRPNYASDDDTLILEDETGRVALVASAVWGRSPSTPSWRSVVDTLVTGVVLAVRGHVLDSGASRAATCLPWLRRTCECESNV